MLRAPFLFAILAATFFTAEASPFKNPGGADSGTAIMQADFRYRLGKTSEKMVVDGAFDEAIWRQLPAAKGFSKKFPTDVGPVQRQTEVRMTYDDRFLYIGVTAWDSGKAFIRTLKRDGGHDGNDGVAVVIDPLNRQSNGFFFVVNAFNAQSEDQLSGGDGPNFSWDNKWFSETQRFEDRWQAEMAIPFNILRYNEGQQVWGINLVRVDTKTNEYSTWTRMPVNFPSFDLGYTGALVFEESPPKTGRNMVFAPFVTASGSAERRNGETVLDGVADAGFDAKVGLGTSMNLDLTVNPDFSQIEVDRQVTNLSRFNIFFPERRTFFLENADLFTAYGIDPIRPFYSRRIGLDRNGRTIPIIGGARLTGSLGPTTRIGVLNMQTANKGDYNAENFTAATVNQRVLKRSMIKAYFLNRQAFLSDEEKQREPLQAFGRNAGVEFNFVDQPGKWRTWLGLHKSFKPGIDSKDFFGSAGFNYSRRRFQLAMDYSGVGTNYYTDMGFIERIENYDALRDTVIRQGFHHLFHDVSYRWFPTNKKFNSLRVGYENYVVFNPDGSMNEWNKELEFNIDLQNTSNIFFGLFQTSLNLQYPISFTGGKPLPAARYDAIRGFAGYNSDFRKPFSFGTNISSGTFYNGTYNRVRATITYRNPPHVSVQLNAELNRLEFPEEYGETTLLLISPRIDINFTNNIFWTTFLQYNTQANNFNVNSRFQWRYKPMSDLFVVYTDNYFTDPLFRNKSRAIVLKATYWLNL